MTAENRPPRTFGISIAIIVSVMFFTIFPLVQLLILTLIQYRIGQIELAPSVSGTENTAIAVGGSFGTLTSEYILLQAICGIVFFVIAIFAWRGRPKSVRYLFMLGVVALSIFYAWDSLAVFFSPLSAMEGIDSGAEVRRILQLGRLFANLIVPLYVLWYMNRAPARAFFRGSYAVQGRE